MVGELVKLLCEAHGAAVSDSGETVVRVHALPHVEQGYTPKTPSDCRPDCLRLARLSSGRVFVEFSCTGTYFLLLSSRIVRGRVWC